MKDGERPEEEVVDLAELRKELADMKRMEEEIERLESDPFQRQKTTEYFDGLKDLPPLSPEAQAELDEMARKAFKRGLLLFELEEQQPTDN